MLRTFCSRLLLAIVIVTFHLSIFYAAGGRKIENFVHFDGGWYHCIVTNGYQTDDPPKRQACSSNVAFYPGYPMTARWLHQAVDMPPYHALLAVSLTAAVAMWLYFFLLLHALAIPWRIQAAAALLLLSHPAAFFLIVGYSESLFLMALLGTMYWSVSTQRFHGGWALLHGIVMTATRAVGVAFVPFIVLSRFLPEWKTKGFRHVLRTAWRSEEPYLGAAMLVGMISFYVYTWIAFGHFDLYFQTGKIGWDITPNYAAFFSDALFKFWTVSLVDAGKLNKNTMPLMVLLFIGIAIVEVRRVKSYGLSDAFLRLRAPACLCSILMFYLVFSARYEMWFESCLRYSLGWYAPIVVCLASYFKESMPSYERRTRILAVAALGAVAMASFYSQVTMMERFAQGKWVAGLDESSPFLVAQASVRNSSHQSSAR